MPNHNPSSISRVRDMAVFGLKKAFVTPAPKPVRARRRMKGFFCEGFQAERQWLPE